MTWEGKGTELDFEESSAGFGVAIVGIRITMGTGMGKGLIVEEVERRIGLVVGGMRVRGRQRVMRRNCL